jgi:glyoxylase-like metal-dependent hydrolase (beta-lactamase superfamily II)
MDRSPLVAASMSHLANAKRIVRLEPALTFAMLAVFGLPHQAGAQASGPVDLVKQALEAMGGIDAMRGLQGLAVKGTVRHWEPEESYVAGGPPVFTDHSTFTMIWDVKNGMARTDWDRAIQFPAVTHDVYSEIVTPTRGYADVAGTELVINQSDLPPKGQQAMSGIRLAAHLRELERSSPVLLLKALDAPQQLTALPDQRLGGGAFDGGFGGIFPAVFLPAVAFADGGTTFTILFDRTSHLPAAIRTLDDDALLGDSNYDLILSDWQPAGGVKIARSLTYTLNNMHIGKMEYTGVVANPQIPDETFAFSAAIGAAAKPPATADVPFQWVLRRLNFNRFPDSDAVNFMPGGGLKLVELSPNVQQVVGGSHNGLIVAMQDFLVIFDAPINEWQSRFTIDAAKAKYPGKPVKYLVLTHHHTDHAGGARTYVAEGASVIVPSPDKAFFEQVFAAPHAVIVDELQKHQKSATVIEVADQMTLRDDGGEIRLYNIANPHVDGMLVGYMSKDDILWVTDMYSPARDARKSPGAVNLYEALKQLGIKPSRLAGGHGGSASYAEFEAIEK